METRSLLSYFLTLGGFATHMVVHDRFCIAIPDAYPLDRAVPIMTGGGVLYDVLRRVLTRYRSWSWSPEESGTVPMRVGVVGLGVLSVPKALGCTVTACSRSDAQLSLYRK